MNRSSAFLYLAMCPLIPACIAAGGSTVLAHLPDASINAAKVDASGDIYIAGSLGDTTGPGDAFVAKLSSDGSKMIYSTVLGGSKPDSAIALDIDSAGAAYVFGWTQSADFPTTSGALQETLGSEIQGFVAKVDAQGKVVYDTLVGDSSDVHPRAGGILVDAAGNAIVSGQTIGQGFPSAEGAPFTNDDLNAFFVLKLNSTGTKVLASVRGAGGRLASDDEGSIYVAGVQLSVPTPTPITAGAFQTGYALHACGGTGQLAFACSYQYVAKLDASLTRLVYSTYLTGSYGAVSSAIFVDSEHNVLLAGTTHSPDYPTTPDAFQPGYIANAPPPPQTCLFGCVFPPPASGYFTKLNSSGSALVYSTFLSGTQSETIDFASLAGGPVILSGQAASGDLPALADAPPQCLPQTFATRLSADGSSVSATRIVPGGVLAYEPLTGTLLVWNGSDLVRFDPEAPPPPVACVLDAADLRPVSAIAPGELLSIFGPHFVNTASVASGPFPPELGGVTVAFNGTAGPMLYASPQQINVQAPYEIAGSSQAVVDLSSAETAASLTFPVTARNPVAFLDTTRSSQDSSHCVSSGAFYNGGPIPFAFNSDGSRNSCSNPAAQGSLVKVFLAGLGLTEPVPATGAVNPDSGVPLNLPVTLSGGSGTTVVSATALPGSISGVWQVVLRVPSNQGALSFSLSIDSIPVRDMNLTLWVR